MPGLWVCEPLETFEHSAKSIYYVTKTLQILEGLL